MTVTFAWFEKQLDQLDAAYWPALVMAGHLPWYVQPLVCPLRTVVTTRETLYAHYLKAFEAAHAVDRDLAARPLPAAYPARLAAIVAREARLASYAEA